MVLVHHDIVFDDFNLTQLLFLADHDTAY